MYTYISMCIDAQTHIDIQINVCMHIYSMPLGALLALEQQSG